MMTIAVIRAWKDEDYRRSLSAEQLARLPAHPSGGIEVRQSDRASFEAGRRTQRGGACSLTSHCG